MAMVVMVFGVVEVEELKMTVVKVAILEEEVVLVLVAVVVATTGAAEVDMVEEMAVGVMG